MTAYRDSKDALILSLQSRVSELESELQREKTKNNSFIFSITQPISKIETMADVPEKYCVTIGKIFTVSMITLEQIKQIQVGEKMSVRLFKNHVNH